MAKNGMQWKSTGRKGKDAKGKGTKRREGRKGKEAKGRERSSSEGKKSLECRCLGPRYYRTKGSEAKPKKAKRREGIGRDWNGRERRELNGMERNRTKGK